MRACTQAAPAVFADVPVGSANQREIEAIYEARGHRGLRQQSATGNIAQALAHREKIRAAGGPEKDPDFKHRRRKEIKSFLQNAQRAAKRLPSKLQEAYLKAIQDIAERAGVTL